MCDCIYGVLLLLLMLLLLLLLLLTMLSIPIISECCMISLYLQASSL